MSLSTKQLGKIFEDLAVNYLQNNDFIVLTRNYQYQRAEIDIIAQKAKCLHFIEVKARNSTTFGHPESFVSSGQAKRIKTGAENYILAVDWLGSICFDILAITYSKSRREIVFFQDVFV